MKCDNVMKYLRGLQGEVAALPGPSWCRGELQQHKMDVWQREFEFVNQCCRRNHTTWHSSCVSVALLRLRRALPMHRGYEREKNWYIDAAACRVMKILLDGAF